eukprot:GDKJ01031110.1.p1 GENE.GDKJ01031110.1~~GDKJ01031110.1.p1  ORF type:complete len:194 (-),score=36.88 GDKJ01031110.1:194-775(-)
MAQKEKIECHPKVVLLGEASVGKSCIALRFCRDEFNEKLDPTIGAAFLTQSIDLGNALVKFDIWDTAGQERYRSLTQIYYRGAAAALIVFDLSSMSSFENAKRWIPELNSLLDEAVLALVGNKCDLPHREVDTTDAKKFAEENNLYYIETSAKTGENVREMFEEIARRIPKTPKVPRQIPKEEVSMERGGACC